MLSKLDGLSSQDNVLVIGTTNRIDLIDNAALRPGRLEVHVEIPLPDKSGRREILNIHTNQLAKHGAMAKDADDALAELSRCCVNFTGAELEGVVRNASSFALERYLKKIRSGISENEVEIKVTANDFLRAGHEIAPVFGNSVSVNGGNNINRKVGTYLDDCSDKLHSQNFNSAVDRCCKVVRQIHDKSQIKGKIKAIEITGQHGNARVVAEEVMRTINMPLQRTIEAIDILCGTESNGREVLINAFDSAKRSPGGATLLLLDLELWPEEFVRVMVALMREGQKNYMDQNRKITILVTSDGSRDHLFDEQICLG